MRNLHFLAAVAAAAAVPTAAQAQRADIIVVDTDRIMSQCTACQSARSQLQQRETTLRNRAQQLSQQLQTEGKPLQDAVSALAGKQPDQTLQARIRAFQQKEQQAATELQNSQQTLQSTAAHVQQQIGARLVQVVEQVRARRQASIAIAKDSTLANDNALDVTGEVLTALNSALPSVSVTPLPQRQQQQQQQPQGR
ncbi:MAG TPA: OmpH family outer membrane protein [Sphingomicrobium sp.]|nr:OmpH family outer membrane protein [Sphingomicrobium sp.]